MIAVQSHRSLSPSSPKSDFSWKGPTSSSPEDQRAREDDAAGEDLCPETGAEAPGFPKRLNFGASAGLAATASNAFVASLGRPDDVKTLAPDVLRHRLVVTYEAEAQGVDAEAIVARLLDGVGIP